MEYTLTNNGFQPKKEVEKAKKILKNIDYIREVLDKIEDTIENSVNIDKTREDFIRHLNQIGDDIRYLQDSFFYPIKKEEND